MADPVVGVVMGSDSDWETMQHAARRLEELGVPFEARVVSAHRTPDLLFRYAEEAAGRGLRCIIAGAGGAAHLPGMLAAKTALPIFGVPVPTKHLQGLDSLLSIVQMPAGIPVATFAIGAAGAQNAALCAAAVLALDDPELAQRLEKLRREQTRRVLDLQLAGRARVILPGATLGVLGGGQLGRMFVLQARTMGYRVIVLDPDPGSPAGQVADVHLRAAYTDLAALDRLAAICAAVTTEFENVPAEALERLARSCRVRPPVDGGGDRAGPDRREELPRGARASARRRSVRCGPRRSCADALALGPPPRPAQDQPAGLRRQGPGDDRAPGGWRSGVRHGSAAVACVLEERLALETELSVVLARGDDGAVAAFPVGENRHRDGILETTVVPARVSRATADEARDTAARVAAALDYVGVLGVELFVADGGRIYVNEIAPRPHNSGHYTLDACSADQFEQQLRALCGLPLARAAGCSVRSRW